MVMLGAVLTIVAHREMRGAGGWAQGWLVPLVGLAFVVAGVVSRAGSLVRSLVVAVGVTWLLPTFVPETLLLHQAVLLVLIGVFPTGRLRTPGWFLVAGAALVALLLVPQLGVAALLLGAAVVAATELRQERAAGVAPGGSGGGGGPAPGGVWARGGRCWGP